MVCGPNSFCVTDNHNMNCICNAGHSGDPNDLEAGCKPDKSCSTAKDCPKGTMCQVNINGRRSCLDPCQVMSCPEGERCELHSGGLPVCACRAGQVKNKLTGRCEAKSGCTSDADCHSTQACRADQGYGAFR